MEIIISSHKDLDLWNLSIKLVIETYKETGKFPEFERFSLSNQMRRSCVSVACNIAVGDGRETRKEFIRYLYKSHFSCSELETQFVLAKELGYINEISSIETLIKSVKLMINGLINKLSSTNVNA